MLRKKLLLASCCFCLATFLSFNIAQAQNAQNFDEIPAQGDGDPTEISVEEQLQAEKELADAEKLDEDNVATITASGDFLVPTYLLPVVDNKETASDTATPTPKVTQTNVKTKTTRQLPTVVIRQTELTPVAEQMEVERRLTGETTQTQKIYREALARQKAKEAQVSADEKDTAEVEELLKDEKPATEAKAEKPAKPFPLKAKKNEGRNLVQSTDDIDDILEGTDSEETASNTDNTKKPLLLPLRPMTGTIKVKKDTTDTASLAPKVKSFPSVYADKVLSAAQSNETLPLIMPMDLKVSFYPNDSAFSGQSVKWIKAFAYRALQDPRYVVDIRVSKENPLLQQKRLYLVVNVLRSTGLSLHQLSIDYVDRKADSMILRMVKKAQNVQVEKRGLGRKKEKETIKW